MIHLALLLAFLLLVTLAIDAGYGTRPGLFMRWLKYRLTPEPKPAPKAATDAATEPAPTVNVQALLAELEHAQEAAAYWYALAEQAVAEYLALEEKVLQARGCPLPESEVKHEEIAN